MERETETLYWHKHFQAFHQIRYASCCCISSSLLYNEVLLVLARQSVRSSLCCFIWVLSWVFRPRSVSGSASFGRLTWLRECRDKPVSRFLLIWTKCPYRCCQECPGCVAKVQELPWSPGFPGQVWGDGSGGAASR